MPMDADAEARYRHPDTWFTSGSTRLTPGEVCDRLSVLALKIRYSKGTARQAHFHLEEVNILKLLPSFGALISGHGPTAVSDAVRELAAVNTRIWQRTGSVRQLLVPPPASPLTDAEALLLGRNFIEIFGLNERRAALVQAINEAMAAPGEGEKI